MLKEIYPHFLLEMGKLLDGHAAFPTKSVVVCLDRLVLILIWSDASLVVDEEIIECINVEISIMLNNLVKVNQWMSFLVKKNTHVEILLHVRDCKH